MISQTAEYRPEKIEKLIYLAAYLIPNGKTQAEYSAQDVNGLLKPFVTRFPETPCEKIYCMPTSHSPFFSKPKELCMILEEIAQL